ncbi:substrate-binding periplasmic protein [Roseibium aggregatum]|uniref:Transporter substrate-binding domain-containing protein n=1 Tax=Roseibium aggregatum TaxID=187304 RepID=A0A939EH51_9HYPH|nr:transporter substrate-binding domain-containing protein [Roseibium aggregatum]MBN9672367.1 transporter substrate-binding domain-containing protein [Roseibium aggregatum]
MRTPGLIFYLIVFISFLTPVSAHHDGLIVSFGSHYGEPYAFVENGRLVGGIVKDIMDEVANEIDVEISYENIPRARMDNHLLTGKSHVLVLSSPRWYTNPEQFLWSETLFRESGRYVVSVQNSFSVADYDDLTGKRIGTIRGYRYPGELDERFSEGTVIRDDVDSLASNFKRLKLGRIDALLDADTLILHYLAKHQAQGDFIVAEKIESTHDVKAMISRKSPVPFDDLARAFRKLKDSGRIDEILEHYR